MVELRQHVADRRHRRRWVERDAGPGAQMPDVRERPVQVREHLGVDGDHGRSGGDERLQVAVRLGNHEVHVERQLRDALERRDDQRADGDVRHEVPVHHVHVDEVGAARFDPRDVVAQLSEIRGENRRGNPDRRCGAHRLTVSEMASPGPI